MVLEFSAGAIMRNKEKINRKRRSQIIFICRLYGPIFKRPSRLHQKTSRSDKHFGQSSSIQSQHVKISNFLYANISRWRKN
jgi:hypothetical protein